MLLFTKAASPAFTVKCLTNKREKGWSSEEDWLDVTRWGGLFEPEVKWTHSSLKGFHQSEGFLRNLPCFFTCQKNWNSFCSFTLRLVNVYSFQYPALSLFFHLCIRYVLWKKIYESECVWGQTDTMMQLSGVFTVPGVRFSQSPVVSTKQAAPSHCWNDSHFSSLSLSPSSFFFIYYYYNWSTYRFQKQNQDVLPLLPIHYPESLLLPCHWRKLRWDQEKANPPSCSEEYSLLGHLDSILFPLDVIFFVILLCNQTIKSKD